MAETFGRVGGQVEDVRDAMLREDPRNERGVGDRSFVEDRALRQIIGKSSGKIVEPDDFVSASEKVLDDVRSNEAGGAGHEDGHQRVSGLSAGAPVP